ncbi:MAG: hypothetical protein KID09_16510 [Paenibacillus macerans]|nr:hypothetical protein [Paenibacillus macerans]
MEVYKGMALEYSLMLEDMQLSNTMIISEVEKNETKQIRLLFPFLSTASISVMVEVESPGRTKCRHCIMRENEFMKRIIVFDFDFGEIEIMASSFKEYLEKALREKLNI